MTRWQIGDIVQASAARGSFTLRPGDTPVVLLSAGIGVTPVLAMLHALAAEASTREVWWLTERVTDANIRLPKRRVDCSSSLAHHHQPRLLQLAQTPRIVADVDFDAAGRLNIEALQELSLPRNGDFYICGPSTFMSDLTAGLTAMGIAPDQIHTELFGAGPSITPGIAASPRRPPHLADR